MIGSEALDELEDFLSRFVAYPTTDARVAHVLWCAHAHAVDCFESTPRIAFLSPEPGSGKSRCLEVTETVTPQPFSVLSASPPAIFRLISAADRPPTLLFDEVDAVFGRNGKSEDNEDMRGLLNAGHRNGAAIPRCVGPAHEVTFFPVFAAVALAGLGDLPDTLMTRSVVVRMRRRLTTEQVEPFRHRIHTPQGHEVRDQLAAWVHSVREDLRDAWPQMPPGIRAPAADVWEPLLAVADAAGDRWPTRARTACLALASASVSREASLGVRLLTDLKAVFGDDDRMSTATIIERLSAIEEAPWADFRGKPIDARGLAWRLAQYEVSSTKVKVNGTALQGYKREDFYDAWNRYVPDTVREAEPPEPVEPPRSAHLHPVPSPGPGSGTLPLNGTTKTPPDLHRSCGSGGSGLPTPTDAAVADAP